MALKRIEEYLAEDGLSLKDVVAMKVYVAPDPLNDNKPDFDGWFKAYGEFFNNESNPNKKPQNCLRTFYLEQLSEWKAELHPESEQTRLH